MFNDRQMVDRGTSASPPCSPTRQVVCSSTREVACSPINFHSTIAISTAEDFEDDLMMNQQMKMRKDHAKMMNKYVLMHCDSYTCTVINIY